MTKPDHARRPAGAAAGRAVRALRRAVSRRVRARWDRRVRTRLGRMDLPAAATLARALDLFDGVLPVLAQGTLDAIENIRAGMMASGDALNDGTLDAEGPYNGGRTVAGVCRDSKPPRPARFLYAHTRAVQPRRVLELGANVGISSARLAAAGAAPT